jgi:membrane protein YqaA with SNARE-associated domain
MSRFMDWVRGFGIALGAPGLFLLSFLDSSFFPIPEGVDILIILMSIRNPERMVLYATLATLGSMAGCYLLYALARKGGEAFLRKRFKPQTVDRTIARFQKYGLLAVALPALLPPPTPFKLFVLAAGVARVRPVQFLLAVAIGRGVRFFGKGLLAVWYGEAAVAWLRDNSGTAYLVIGLTVAVVGLAYILVRRRRARDAEAGGPGI